MTKHQMMKPTTLLVRKPRAGGKNYQISGTFGGVQVRMSAKTTEFGDACLRARLIEEAILEGRWDAKKGIVPVSRPTNEKTFRDALDKYMHERQINIGKVAAGDERLLERMSDYWGTTPLSSIDQDMIEEFVEWLCIPHKNSKRKVTRLKPGSLRRRLGIFNPVMTKAFDLGWIKEKPKIKKPRVDDERDEHYEADEVAAILEWLRENEPWAVLHFLVLVDTGARMGESLRLECRDVTKSEIVLRKKEVESGKTKTLTRRIPISGGLTEYFDKHGWPKRTTEPLILNKSVGSQNTGTAQAIRFALHDAADALGLPKLRIHDLRHTFAFLAASAGADIGDLQLLMGHKKIEMTMRYRGFIKSRAVDAMKKFRNDGVKGDGENLQEAVSLLKMLTRTGGDAQSIEDAKEFLLRAGV